jgi:5-methylcytosine-specific restriction endonuclease McrA
MKCEICGSPFNLTRHHKFSQTKWARKLYGKLLDDPRNIQIACHNCHVSHLSPLLIHWTEKEFCEALEIKPRSKLAILKERLLN